MNRRSMWVFVGLFLLAGCNTLPKHRVHESLLSNPVSAPGVERIVLMPLDLKVSELSAGGMAEEVEPWTNEAKANFSRALEAALSEHAKFDVVTLPKLSPEEQQALDQHLALYHVVATEAAVRTGNPVAEAWRHKVEHFDYTIGSGLAFLKERTGASRGLFIIGEDVVSSDGRKAVWLAAAMLGIGLPTGFAYAYAGVVEFETGDVLWLNHAVDVANRTFRKPEDVEAMVDEIFKDYPGLDAYLNSKVASR